MKNMRKTGYYARPEKNHEFHLLLLSKSSDFIEAQRAKNKLIQENERFLISFVKGWITKDSPYDLDYLLQEARIAFFNAIERFDLHKGKSIRTYARFHLIKLKETLFEEPILCSIDNISFEEEVMLSLSHSFENFDLRLELISAINEALTKVESEVVYLYFFEGRKMLDIANLRCCSKSRISNIIRIAMPKLKSYLISIGIAPGLFEMN
jgi:RNA polymerase sigma factor (sigma-70 family)